ncbi:SRPBCC domain-containing protein [Pseudonocardia sp. RS11V-5]|uniref:SRPBCC family protein n=1 Tax=Pseudonocardia terrae TaxID=2905831 RepID=UPI001E3F715A|nr:SRPBCC domain-containing protein [Pseudonocardia terrae]MCE3551313.1 SRPBCC domain-containing protein [Pseudonocardia terrae]
MSRPFEIRREVVLPASPEEVWRAIATPEGQAGWFMTGPDPEEAGAEFDEDPPRRLEQRFGTQAIEYVLEAASGGTTVLRFVHSGMAEDDWGDEFETMTGFGWDLYLFTLGEYVRHFPGRPAVYIEAEAPNSPDAWKRILAALGDPAEGDPVELLGGPGVVDKRTEHYLGVRTADALIRFHERSLLGMPVAVGHHAYAPGVDATATTAEWTRWFADVVAG